MNNLRKMAETYRKIRPDYEYKRDIFTDDVKVQRLKEIIAKDLTPVDRTIFLLYADCMSYRKLAAMMGLSHTTVRKQVQRIKKIILQKYETDH